MKRLLIAIMLFSLVVPFGSANEEILSNKPLSPEYDRAKHVYTHLVWGTYLQTANRLSDAKKEYLAVLDVIEESAFVHTQLARLSLRLQDVKRAESECRRAIEIAPQKADAHFLLGQILIQRLSHSSGKLEDAIAEFQKVIELNPNHAEGHRYLGELATLLPDYEVALHAFKELTRIAPYQSHYHMRLATIYSQLDQNDEAIAAYERVIKIDRDLSQAYEALAQLYIDKYQAYHRRIYSLKEETPELLKETLSLLEKVISAYTELRRLSLPADQAEYNFRIADLQAHLGSFYLRLENTVQAIKVCHAALENDSNQVDAHFWLGLAYQETGDFDKAEFYLRRAIALDPDHEDAYESLGYLYIAFKRPEKAIEVWQEILKSDGEQAEAHYWLGLAYQDVGNFDKAEYHIRQTIAIDPDREDAYNALGYLFAENNKNLDEAIELIKTALQKSPQSGAYLDSLGWAYFKQGKLDEALRELEKADRYMPENSEIKDHLGEVYLKKGLKQKAIAAWQQASQLDPDNVRIQQKLRIIQEE